MKKLIFILSIMLIFLSCEGYNQYVALDKDTSEYPRHLSWADIDSDGDGVRENYVTSIKHQSCNDCYIYTAVGILETQYQIDHKVHVSLNLSEQSIHNCLRISCSATGDDRSILNHLRDYGIMEETYAKTNMWGQCDNCVSYLKDGIGPISVENVPFFRFREWRAVVSSGMNYKDRKKALVAALQDGPISIHIDSWRGFRKDRNTLYCVEKKPSGHVVIAIGYRDHGKAFIVKNSHGENGLIKIVFDGSEKCGFAFIASQIVPGTTYFTWGWGENYCYSTDDKDSDGIPDVHDNCPYIANEDQKNFDGDIFGDVCDKCPKDENSTTGFYCAPK